MSYRQTRYTLLVLWSILMSIFTLMAFAIPDQISKEERGALFYTFFNASGAIQPSFLRYWGEAYRPVLYVFGTVHLIMSIWMVLEYFIVNWPNFRLPSLFYSIVTKYVHIWLLKLGVGEEVTCIYIVEVTIAFLNDSL